MAHWRERIDVSVMSDDSMPFEQQRDRVVAAIRASAWYQQQESELEPLLGDMEHAQDGDAFDDPMSSVYDLADQDRVWLSPFRLDGQPRRDARAGGRA